MKLEDLLGNEFFDQIMNLCLAAFLAEKPTKQIVALASHYQELEKLKPASARAALFKRILKNRKKSRKVLLTGYEAIINNLDEIEKQIS